MSKKFDLSGILLAGVSGVYMLTLMLIRAFAPAIIIPKFDILTVLSLSLVALVLDYYISKECKRNYLLSALYGFLIFGIFPWVACFVEIIATLKLAIISAVIFTAATFIFDSIINRLSSGPAGKIAPLISVVGLYLAAQCLMGIF